MASIKAISLFSSAGIGEFYLNSIGIDVVLANELLPRRSECYSFLYPKSEMINGDIREPNIKNYIKNYIKNNDVKLLLATPPCQGFSTLGKNKIQGHYELDIRNFLVFDILEIIDTGNFDYILIENVPKFLKMLFPFEGEIVTLEEILNRKYKTKYNIDIAILNAENYGIAQSRPRGIIRMYKKGLNWSLPIEEKIITLEQAIGNLPSLEAGEKSSIQWHFAKQENPRYIVALRNTPTGASAMKNLIFFPKKEDGERMKGFHNTFKRMRWDQPAPARTTFCGNINSHNNVHPGRLLPDGTYSDARALTPLETFIVSGLPREMKFPKWASQTFINTIIGEAVPPVLLKKILISITK